MRLTPLTLLLLAACSNSTTGTGSDPVPPPPSVTETGNPEFTTEMYVVPGGSGAGPIISADGVELVVGKAWAVFADVSMVPDALCEVPAEAPTVLPGPLVVNLLDPDAPPAELALRTGTYCGLRLPLEHGALLPADAPPSLRDASWVLQLQSVEGLDIQVTGAGSPIFEIESDVPFQIAEDDPALFLGLDFQDWLSELSLEELDSEGDGSVLIDANQNAELLHKLEEGFAEALDLYRDTNNNGQLDSADALLTVDEP